MTRTFGRVGSGPGEFQIPYFLIAPGPGDSLHVLDHNRWMVFAPPNYEFVRFVKISGEPTDFVVIDSGANRGDLLVADPARVASGQLFTVHLISARTGGVIRSFDAPATADLRGENDAQRTVAWYDGSVWSLPINRMSIRSEPLKGGAIREWIRTDGWFPARSQDSDLEPFIARPTPRAWRVRPTAQLLGVFGTVSDANWKALATSPNDPALRRWATVDMNKVFDTVIEVIDRNGGRALSRLRSDLILGAVRGSPSLVIRKKMDADGVIAIDLFNVSLRR